MPYSCLPAQLSDPLDSDATKPSAWGGVSVLACVHMHRAQAWTSVTTAIWADVSSRN